MIFIPVYDKTFNYNSFNHIAFYVRKILLVSKENIEYKEKVIFLFYD
jgi:hypothetical protein